MQPCRQFMCEHGLKMSLRAPPLMEPQIVLYHWFLDSWRQ